MRNQSGEKEEDGRIERGRRSTGQAAERRRQEEGKGRNRRLSSQNLKKEADERKRKIREKAEGESRRQAPVEQLWEAKQGGTKGNKQKSRVQESGKNA